MTRLQTDWIRIVAIIAVLLIHVTSPWEKIFAQEQFDLEIFFAVFLNQWARFSVPLFVLLSGYALAEKYQEKINLKEFFSKRFYKIGIPFAFWTLILLSFIRPDGFFWSSSEGILNNIKNNLLILLPFLYKRGADYHFYFFQIILQCYLIFPLLLKIKWRRFIWILLILHFFYQSPIHVLIQFFEIKRPTFPTSFFIHWVFYFSLGISISRNKQAWLTFCNKYRRLIFATTIVALIGLLIEYKIWSEIQKNPDWYNHFSRISVTLYAIFSTLTFISFLPSKEQSTKTMSEKISLLSSLTFFVYLFHTQILRLLRPIENLVFQAIFTTLISFLLAYIFWKFLPKSPLLRTIFALPPRK